MQRLKLFIDFLILGWLIFETIRFWFFGDNIDFKDAKSTLSVVMCILAANKFLEVLEKVLIELSK